MSQCYVRKLIIEAMKWEGYKEKATNAHLESKTANAGSNNYTWFADYIYKNYPKWFTGNKNSFPHCSLAVQYWHLKAFGFNDAVRITYQPSKDSLSPSCLYAYRYFKKVGKVGKEPKVGASIFFTNNKQESGIHHTGIVIAYNNTTVRTFESNTSNMCAYRTYKRNSSTIFGYGYPDFDKDPNGDPTATEFMDARVECDNPTTATDVKIISISTKTTKDSSSVGGIDDIPFGNLNSLNKEPKAIGKVTATILNVRKLPGAENKPLDSIPMVRKDTELEICDKLKAANDKPWLYVRINKKTYGFVSAAYVDLISNDVSDDSDKYSTR